MTIPRKLAYFQLFTLCVCIGLSFLFFFVAGNTVQVQAQDRFHALVSQGLSSMGRRADEYGRTLDGVAGFVAASDEVTAQDMETYATSVHIADGSYVLDAIGFAVPVYDETDGTLKDFVIQRATPTENFAGMVGTEFSSNSDLLATALATYASGKTLSTTPALHGENCHALLIKPIFRPGTASDGTRDPDDI